jgi:membrane protein insertase Oxa1/YidC/SpoIIIJ
MQSDKGRTWWVVEQLQPVSYDNWNRKFINFECENYDLKFKIALLTIIVRNILSPIPQNLITL